MDMMDIPFQTTDWSGIEPTYHQGESGMAIWRTRQFGSIRVRMVEYSPGYREHIPTIYGQLRFNLAWQFARRAAPLDVGHRASRATRRLPAKLKPEGPGAFGPWVRRKA